MLNFAALTPHPPIIIPEIGGEDSKKTSKTITAMEKLSIELKKTSPDTIIIISPHGLVYPDRINICGMLNLRGTLSQFGIGGLKFKFQNDPELAEALTQKAEENGIQTLLYDNDNSFFELDHGTVVPLYFLAKELKKDIKILPIAYSYQDKGLLFAFGEIIQEVAAKSKKKIALIASGDLSHRLTQTAPAGYNESGKEFDKLIINHLKAKDIQGILEMDDDFIEDAGECGYRSILILIGALSKTNFKPEILSYEGPFGVGYAVINFKIL
ncbi:MAG: AmmeMemoRadiSam system protein B [Candidatus Berkelbacteria bacterium]|nr:AmmeMemoRadiSam system protein B [Candidatus Berkelbacteria bacterium]